MQRTLVLLKPDAVQRRLIGRLIARFEDKGAKIVAMKMQNVAPALARRLYKVHQGKDFYAELVRFITSGPVVAMVLEGVDVIAIVRRMIGSTFGPEAQAGTIRGDFGASRRFNVVHASDSAASARTEIALFFPKSQRVQYDLCGVEWLYARDDGRLI